MLNLLRWSKGLCTPNHTKNDVLRAGFRGRREIDPILHFIPCSVTWASSLVTNTGLIQRKPIPWARWESALKPAIKGFNLLYLPT